MVESKGGAPKWERGNGKWTIKFKNQVKRADLVLKKVLKAIKRILQML